MITVVSFLHMNNHHSPHQSLLTQDGGLHIVAVGSVLVHCWDLLKEGKSHTCLATQAPEIRWLNAIYGNAGWWSV